MWKVCEALPDLIKRIVGRTPVAFTGERALPTGCTAIRGEERAQPAQIRLGIDLDRSWTDEDRLCSYAQLLQRDRLIADERILGLSSWVK